MKFLFAGTMRGFFPSPMRIEKGFPHWRQGRDGKEIFSMETKTRTKICNKDRSETEIEIPYENGDIPSPSLFLFINEITILKS